MKNTVKKLLVLTMALVLIMGIIPVSAKSKKTTKTTIALDKTFVDLLVKKKAKITIKNVPTDAKISWDTSDKKVVTISSQKDGKVTIKGKKAGTAIITATVDGKDTYSCGVTVFKKGDKLYEWRKNAVGVRDNYSLIALYTPINDTYSLDEYGLSHATVDLVQTRKNLLATGLFEEIAHQIQCQESYPIEYNLSKKRLCSSIRAELYDEYGITNENMSEVLTDELWDKIAKETYENSENFPLGIKPINTFTYDGVTYNWVAESDGYYIDCFTGAVYNEFSPEKYELQNGYGDCHFRNKEAKVFITDNNDCAFLGYNIRRDGYIAYCLGAGLNAQGASAVYDLSSNNGPVCPIRYINETFFSSEYWQNCSLEDRYGNWYIYLDENGDNILHGNSKVKIKNPGKYIKWNSSTEKYKMNYDEYENSGLYDW